MSNATKRQRKKDRRAERLRLESQMQRRKKLVKTGAIVGTVAIVLGAAFFTIRAIDSNKKSKAKSDCVPTATPPAGSPALQVDQNKPYTATIETSEGTMVASLDVCKELWGANNFVSLARKGFYDNLTFHRAAKDFVIQGGDPNGNGSGGPGYTFTSELPPKGYSVGDLSYAKTGSDPAGTAGSQFFVITAEKGLTTFNAKPYQYGVFGKLTSGLDIAKKIEALAPESGDGAPTKEVKIVKVTIDGPVYTPPSTTTTPAGASTTSSTTAPTTSSSQP